MVTFTSGASRRRNLRVSKETMTGKNKAEQQSEVQEGTSRIGFHAVSAVGFLYF